METYRIFLIQTWLYDGDSSIEGPASAVIHGFNHTDFHYGEINTAEKKD